MIAPVVASMINPAVEEYVPPLVPVSVTTCPEDKLLQKGVPVYEIVADGKVVMFTVFVDVAFEQPLFPVAVNVKVTLPAVISAALGV